MNSFREKVAYNDGSYFMLIYDGTPIGVNEDEYHEIERRIRGFMDNRDIHDDVVKNISFLRTIFVDYDEKYLYIKYSDKSKVEYVEYKNKELTLYDCKILESNKKGNKSSQNNLKQRSRIMDALKNIGPIGIGPTEYRLIDCYNYFYDMNPNFSNRQVSVLFQCMILILRKYGINVLELNDYVFDQNLGIPVSQSLDKIVSDLFPYGMIRKKGNDKSLTEDEIVRIKTIGKDVFNQISGVDRFQGVMRITSSLYNDENKLDEINQKQFVKTKKIKNS